MNRYVALILSFVYCGFGQIYRGYIIKGVAFVLIYTALIFFLLFPMFLRSDGKIVATAAATGSNLIQVMLVIMLILSWLTGMVDAYISDEYMKSQRILSSNKILTVWIPVVFSCSVFMVIILIAWPHILIQSVENAGTNINRNLLELTYAKTESQEVKVSNPESQVNTLQASPTEQKPESQEGIAPKMQTTPMPESQGNTLQPPSTEQKPQSQEVVIPKMKAISMPESRGNTLQPSPTEQKPQSQEVVTPKMKTTPVPESRGKALQSSSTKQKPQSQEIVTQKMKTTPVLDIDEKKRIISARIEGSTNVKGDNKSSSLSDFYVQVGAFSGKPRAESLAQQLKEKGYSVIITSSLTGKNPKLYKVRIGSYGSRNEAAKSAEELKSKLGITGIVVK
jgi:cell division protein FtsN